MLKSGEAKLKGRVFHFLVYFFLDTVVSVYKDFIYKDKVKKLGNMKFSQCNFLINVIFTKDYIYRIF